MSLGLAREVAKLFEPGDGPTELVVELADDLIRVGGVGELAHHEHVRLAAGELRLLRLDLYVNDLPHFLKPMDEG